MKLLVKLARLLISNVVLGSPTACVPYQINEIQFASIIRNQPSNQHCYPLTIDNANDDFDTDTPQEQIACDLSLCYGYNSLDTVNDDRNTVNHSHMSTCSTCIWQSSTLADKRYAYRPETRPLNSAIAT